MIHCWIPRHGAARIPTNHYRVVGDFEDIERSGEQRVGAAAWPSLLSLPAVHPMVTVPTMFHGRVAVPPVVAIVAAIQEGQFGFNFSSVCYESPNQATSATMGARFGRAARPPRTTRSLNL